MDTRPKAFLATGNAHKFGEVRVIRESVAFSVELESAIAHPAGCDGVGYNPVFVPAGFDRTFADMSEAEKHAVSHRGKAVRMLGSFLSP